MFLATHGILSTTSDLYLPWSNDVYSFDYDGSLDYINVGNDPLLNFEKDDTFSLSCWFKCSSSSNFQTLISKVNSSNQGYYMGISSNGKMLLVLRDLSGNVFYGFTNEEFDDNQWYHVLAVYEGGNNVSNISIYVDGINLFLIRVGTSLTGTIQNSSNVQIGARNGVDIINGLIDEPAIFNTTLGSLMYGTGSVSDITQLNPKGWWRAENATFNGSNWIINNAYKKGFNGTSVSMTSGSRVTDIPT